MQEHEKFMRITIKEALKSKENGGAPTAAIIVKNGEVISTGWSMVGINMDPSGHSELEAIKKACKKLNTLELKGCTLYSTVETCSMCLGCASWSGLTSIVFGAYKEDIPGNSYAIKEYNLETESSRMDPEISTIGGVLGKECAELMKDYENWMPAGNSNS